MVIIVFTILIACAFTALLWLYCFLRLIISGALEPGPTVSARDAALAALLAVVFGKSAVHVARLFLKDDLTIRPGDSHK